MSCVETPFIRRSDHAFAADYEGFPPHNPILDAVMLKFAADSTDDEYALLSFRRSGRLLSNCMDSVLADFSRSRTAVNHARRDLPAPVTKSMTNGSRPAEVFKHNLARRGEGTEAQHTLLSCLTPAHSEQTPAEY